MIAAREQRFKRSSDGAIVYAAPSADYPGWWIVSERAGCAGLGSFVPDTAMELQYERIMVPACERCGHIPPYTNDWKYDGGGNRIYDYPADGMPALKSVLTGSLGKVSILCAGCIDTLREEAMAAHRLLQEECQKREAGKRFWGRSFLVDIAPFFILIIILSALLAWWNPLGIL